MTNKKRRLDMLPSFLALPDQTQHDAKFIVATLNGEFRKDLPEATRHQLRLTGEETLETLRRGIEAIAEAYEEEEGKVIESFDYPDPKLYRGRASDWAADVFSAHSAQNERLAAIDKLNRLLGECRVIQSFVPTLTRDGKTVGWKLDEQYRNPRDQVGAVILQSLIDLARLGLVDRLRRCACGRWFFAERGNQAAHDRRCRQQKYERGSRDKKARREYMRWYYAMYESPKAPRKKLTFQQWQKQDKRAAQN